MWFQFESVVWRIWCLASQQSLKSLLSCIVPCHAVKMILGVWLLLRGAVDANASEQLGTIVVNMVWNGQGKTSSSRCGNLCKGPGKMRPQLVAVFGTFFQKPHRYPYVYKRSTATVQPCLDWIKHTCLLPSFPVFLERVCLFSCNRYVLYLYININVFFIYTYIYIYIHIFTPLRGRVRPHQGYKVSYWGLKML